MYVQNFFEASLHSSSDIFYDSKSWWLRGPINTINTILCFVHVYREGNWFIVPLKDIFPVLWKPGNNWSEIIIKNFCILSSVYIFIHMWKSTNSIVWMHPQNIVLSTGIFTSLYISRQQGFPFFHILCPELHPYVLHGQLLRCIFRNQFRHVPASNVQCCKDSL